MPTTTRSRTQKSRTRTELEQHAVELEALGRRGAPAADPGPCRRSSSMRLSTALLAAGGSVKLSVCRPTGGSAAR